MTFYIPAKEVFSIREASRLLGYSHRALTKAVNDGTIKSVPVSVHHIRGAVLWKQIPRDEIVRLATEKGLLQDGGA